MLSTAQKFIDLRHTFTIILCIVTFISSVSAQEASTDSAVFDNSELLLTADVIAQVEADTVWHPNPKKSTMLSAAIPGAGQIYNGHWWKVPILYAGLGTLGYFVYWNNNSYVRYRNAYIDFVDNDPTTTRYTEIVPPGYVIEDEDWFERTVENRRDSYRRDRDFLIICTIGLYALNVIEANVAAHLHDFDVSDDLSMSIVPDLDYDFMARKPMIGVSLKFNINK